MWVVHIKYVISILPGTQWYLSRIGINGKLLRDSAIKCIYYQNMGYVQAVSRNKGINFVEKMLHLQNIICTIYVYHVVTPIQIHCHMSTCHWFYIIFISLLTDRDQANKEKNQQPLIPLCFWQGSKEEKLLIIVSLECWHK